MGLPTKLLRGAITLAAVGFVSLIIILPLWTVLEEALAQGLGAAWQSLLDGETLRAARLTLLTAAISVLLNTLFGIAAAWLLAYYRFRGRNLVITLIDLPFSVSPVVAGLLFVLLFGAQGIFGPWLSEHDVRIMFAVPGVIIVTTFVTFPFVVREVLPLMESQGQAEEEAALTLGANSWQILWRVTLPKIRWALLHGIILCNARAMGEFGAVSVVSGHIRGQTNTLPLHVEMLYNEYNFVGAFSVATLLLFFGGVTIILKQLVERKQHTLGPLRRNS